jgi:hypothetical protein
MLSIFIPWHKTHLIPPPPQNEHKSNLFPWHKSILCWRCFRDFMEITEMCNRPRLVIDYQIDYHFFQSNRNRNPVKTIAFGDYNW